MKTFITLGKVGDEFELIAGPNDDYKSQVDVLRDATVNGSIYDSLHLVDVGRGEIKRRKPSQKVNKPAGKTKKSKEQ